MLRRVALRVDGDEDRLQAIGFLDRARLRTAAISASVVGQMSGQ
jgi:hypothetical protein